MPVDARFVGGPLDGQVRTIPRVQVGIPVGTLPAGKTLVDVAEPGEQVRAKYLEGEYLLHGTESADTVVYYWKPAPDPDLTVEVPRASPLKGLA